MQGIGPGPKEWGGGGGGGMIDSGAVLVAPVRIRTSSIPKHLCEISRQGNSCITNLLM